MSTHDIAKQVKLYKIIGAILIAGTIVTVLASNVHIGIILGIIVALIIATVKGTLVAGYFMHLFSERRMIYGVLALTAVFIVVMIGLLLFSTGDQQGRHGGAFEVPQKFAEPHHAEAKPESEHVP
jgi:cytochrome c oxidase subunit IV